MRSFIAAAAAAFALGATATGATAITGVLVGPGEVLPSSATPLGMLCRADTAAFRLWWSETPGAAGALPVGGDASCATVPAQVDELGQAAENARAQAVAMGFPSMIGDAPKVFPKSPALTRSLLRSTPFTRARILLSLRATTRGEYLAGLPAATRNRVLKGMKRAARGRFQRDLAAALTGRPSDFTGGDARVDIVVDGTGASNRVQNQQPGVTSCSQRPLAVGSQRQVFSTVQVVVLVPDGVTPRATLVHELFHVVLCNLSASGGTPVLAVEGTAEWFAAQVEPAGFATAPVDSPSGGQTIRGGSSRVISFCDRFDPQGGGLENYNSWGVWRALEAGTAQSSAVLPLLRAFANGSDRPGASAAIARVGVDRWNAAVRTAAQSLCGSLKAPYGDLTFPAGVRDFFGADQPVARVGLPAAITVPNWGTDSAEAFWGSAATATVRLTSAQLAPADLAAAVVATASTGPLSVGVRDGAAVIDIPAAALRDRFLHVVVTNPLVNGALTVQVAVDTGVAG